MRFWAIAKSHPKLCPCNGRLVNITYRCVCIDDTCIKKKK